MRLNFFDYHFGTLNFFEKSFIVKPLVIINLPFPAFKVLLLKSLLLFVKLHFLKTFLEIRST